MNCDTKLFEKFNQVKKIMKISHDAKNNIEISEKEKKAIMKRCNEQMTLIVGILFPDEIDYLFENRQEICGLKSLEFLNEFYLFVWMRDQNIIQYYKFTEGLANVFKEIAKSCNYCDFQIKHLIAYTICKFLKEVYIK